MSKEFTKIVTMSGATIDPLNPHREDINIEDIAHALSLTCRFSGHTRFFYPVARHCMMVADFLPSPFKLYGLLHDAAEAYLTDIPRPFKSRIPGYIAIENNLHGAILEALGIPSPSLEIADAIHIADEKALRIEHQQLIPNTSYWPYGVEEWSQKIEEEYWQITQQKFIGRYDEYTLSSFR